MSPGLVENKFTTNHWLSVLANTQVITYKHIFNILTGSFQLEFTIVIAHYCIILPYYRAWLSVDSDNIPPVFSSVSVAVSPQVASCTFYTQI